MSEWINLNHWAKRRPGVNPTPGYGTCAHCRDSWDHVHGHYFGFLDAEGNGTGSSFFPICDECWRALREADERETLRAYCYALWVLWRDQGDTEHTLAAMDAAVDAHWNAEAKG